MYEHVSVCVTVCVCVSRHIRQKKQRPTNLKQVGMKYINKHTNILS